jgi:hypothetical protein
VSVTGNTSLVPCSTAAIHTGLIGEIGGCGSRGACRPVAWLLVKVRAVGINAVVGPICWLGDCVALLIDVSGEESCPVLRRLLGPSLKVTLGGLDALLVLSGHGEKSDNQEKVVVDGGISRNLWLYAV